MRCFSVLGPSHTGKSTLIEKLGALESLVGTVTSPYSVGLSEFDFFGERWCAIDTPGSNEALQHAQSALLASDVAVLCVSPDPDAAVLAAPYLKAIEASDTPCIVYINRMDEPKGRVADIVAALQDYSNHALVLRQIPIQEGERIVGAVDLISERAWRYREGQVSALVEIPSDMAEVEHEAHAELLEHLSEYDDWLLEELIEDRHPESDAVFSISARILQENKIVPVLVGAASHNNGVMRLMKALRHEAPDEKLLKSRLCEAAELQEADLVAVSFHAFQKPNIGKTVLARALDAGIKQGTRLGGDGLGSVQDPCAGKAVDGGQVQPGQLFSAVKSDHLQAPALLTAKACLDAPAWTEPPTAMFERVIVAENEKDETKLSATLAKVAETDPGITLKHEEGTGAPLICAQGPVHLRNTCKIIDETFNVKVTDRPVGAVYRETITKQADVHYRHRKQTGGAGQFADVKLTVKPNKRGVGFTFQESIKGGAVPRNYIPAVEAGARESLAKGPLGFPVVDIDVSLTDGQHHAVDSSEYAFKAAGRMGVQQGLGEASPVLMQPIYRIECHIPSVYSGNLVPIISSLKGQVLGFDRDEGAKGWDIFRALAPGSALEELAKSLRSTTQGIGYFDRSFDHFEELYGKEADQIIAQNKRPML